MISNDLAIALVLGAGGTAWIAARRFSSLPLHPLRAFAGAVTWLIVCQIPAFDSPAAQMTVSWGFGSIYSLATAAALWPDGKEKLAARPAMLALLIGHGVLYAVRSAAAATGWDEGFRAAFSNTLVIEGQFRVIGMAFLAIALTKQRAELLTAATLDAAHEAVEARRRFLAQMSHEVRTPLNGILGLAQVLARDTRLLPDQRQHVEAVEGAGRHLLAIVNDALDLARIDAGRLDVSGRPFDLQEAADGCLALVRPAATDKQIALVLQQDPLLPSVVVGDRTRLQQILLNLLWNALRFSPAGGQVILRISPASGVLVFAVFDTGPGIPLERRHLLFQDFTQLDPTASEGSGLGLAISARLARQMGGDLTYHPGPNNAGSVFRLELPWVAAMPRIEAQPDPSPAAPAVASMNVLVVDDVPVNRRLLRAMLAHEGHTVEEAQSAEEALAQVQRRSFDVILMDVHMPETNGIEAARRLRRLPNGRTCRSSRFRQM